MLQKKLLELNKLSEVLEKKVLSAVVLEYDKEKAVRILTALSENDFYFHPEVYALLKQSVETKNNFHTMLLSREINTSPFCEYVLERDWGMSLDELRRVGLAREFIIKTYSSVDNSGYKNIEENIAEHISELSKLSIFKGQKIDAKKGVGEYQAYQDEVMEKIKRGEEFIGLPTGFRNIDQLSEGILPRTLTVIGGYSGVGKTSFIVNIIRNILMDKKKVVMFSLEMGASEIFAKLIALGAELNPMKMLKGFLSEDEIARVEKSKAETYEARFEIYDNLRDFDKIKMAMIKESMTDKPDLFVIDYLQMIADPKHKTMVERMSAFPNELKGIAKQTDVPVMAISSISNADARNQNDEVGGYKGSGDIEFAADLAIKLANAEDRETRDQKKKERRPLYIDFIITKQRHGATGAIQMSFRPLIGKFYEGRFEQ